MPDSAGQLAPLGELSTSTGVTCLVFSAAQLLDERERHHLWSGRELRPKDVATIAILRGLTGATGNR